MSSFDKSKEVLSLLGRNLLFRYCLKLKKQLSGKNSRYHPYDITSEYSIYEKQNHGSNGSLYGYAVYLNDNSDCDMEYYGYTQYNKMAKEIRNASFEGRKIKDIIWSGKYEKGLKVAMKDRSHISSRDSERGLIG